MISHQASMNNRHTQGFTLLEVMVALVIFSIGLLGLAGLEAQGMRFNHSAYLRTQATFQAYDILDRMRANREAAANNNYNATPSSVGIDHSCDTPSVTCSTLEMAQYDIFQWKNNLGGNLGILPNGNGSVTRSTNVYVISVTWADPGVPGNQSSITIRSEL